MTIRGGNGRRPRRILLRRALVALVACGAALLLGAPGWAGETREPAGLHQIGTYDALISPDYRGQNSLAPVLTSNAIGLGTFADLDGELVILAGIAYRVGTDGVPRQVAGSVRTPFAQAATFTPQRSGPIAPGTSCAQLAEAVNALVGRSGGLVAVRVRGTFADLITRSVPAQTEPYPSLAAVVATQTVFQLGRRNAVLVGFRQGPDFLGVGAPGLHLHALTTDRTAGGHVLSCMAGPDVQLSVQSLPGVTIYDTD
ncbi:MAG: acetolactate decarboxylase [Actinomycetales bacterium]|nr:acetolactate decarboxylase [Actinomycetales bacterium]